ncbi:MAG: Ldh family oxidoreductase [bacterium]|nr:Ldh family oxidoreductase [bacterium]
MNRVAASLLREFSITLLMAAGFPHHDASDMAECLLVASLRGVDTHGVTRLPAYIRVVQSGKCPAAADIRVVADAGSAALLDGGGGFGFVPATRAMRIAIEKARAWGIGAVGVRNSGHYGMAACYPLLAVRDGMLGIAVTNSDALVTAPGFRGRLVGNNPVALAAPAGDGPPLVLDIASSVASMAKIRRAQAAGECIPAGWGVDASGHPTDDPGAVIDGGALLPFGGHKGFGLALFAEVLSGLLTGGPFGKHAHAGLHYGGTKDDKCGHFLVAVSVDAFMPADQFAQRMTAWIAELKSHPAVDGEDRVRLPGERAYREERRRLAEGIPLSTRDAKELRVLARELRVPPPLELEG